MTAPADRPKTGQTYETPGGDRVHVIRVARNGQWADTRVTQPDGATWTKRQPLVLHVFAFECRLIEEES